MCCLGVRAGIWFVQAPILWNLQMGGFLLTLLRYATACNSSEMEDPVFCTNLWQAYTDVFSKILLENDLLDRVLLMILQYILLVTYE